MDERTYEYLSAVLEHGSFSEAAKALYISQSALSQFIKRMEDKLGIRIFVRDVHPTQLTATGQIVMESLKKMRSAEDHMMLMLQEMNNLQRGHLTIGTSYYRAYYFLSPVIKKFRQLYPGVDLKLLEAKTFTLEQLAAQRKTDFSFTYIPVQEPNLKTIPLIDEEVYIAGPRTHPLVKKLGITFPQMKPYPQVDVKEFCGDFVIRSKQGQQLREFFDRMEQAMGQPMKVFLETESMVTAKKFAADGLGITLIPELMADNWKEGACYFRPNPPFQKRRAAICYNAASELSKPARIFIRMLQEFVQRKFLEN